jgi:hypothetical protein
VRPHALACAQRTRSEVSEQFCSAVFVGYSGVGKSTMLNTVLMLTEVDELTYASPAFHDTAPRIIVPTVNKLPMEYRLEAIQARMRAPAAAARANIARWACAARAAVSQHERAASVRMRLAARQPRCLHSARPQVIKKLLKDEGVSKQNMDSAFAQRVTVIPVRQEEHSDAKNIEKRAEIDRDVYQKVENFAAVSALGGNSKVPFLHPVGYAPARMRSPVVLARCMS